MKKIKQFLVMLLVISLSITSLGSTVFAAGDFSSETQDEQITDSSQNLNVEGTDSVGDMLASVISEENNNSEERKQSANNITGLEIEDDTAVVEFQTQTDAEVVVAVYDEQRVQMLASGNEMVSQDENMATVTIQEICHSILLLQHIFWMRTVMNLCAKLIIQNYIQKMYRI